MTRAKKMQRHIPLVADHPAVVRLGRNMKQRSRSELPHPAILERDRCRSLENESEMLDAAQLQANSRTDIDRPPPTRFVGRATDRHPADVHQLEAALGELAQLVRILEA